MDADSNKSKLQKLIWVKERTRTQMKLQEKLSEILPINSFSFLSFKESDDLQLSQDEWPNKKWEDRLYFQTDISDEGSIAKIIASYIELNQAPVIHLFFMNYNSCLVSMSNRTLLDHWKQLLELDGDEIFITMPSRPFFMCVEITEDLIVGREEKGRFWIYEITVSNKQLADTVL
jgi:hypothetical protein